LPNPCPTPPALFLELQADYVVHTFVRSWGLNMWGSIWYTLEDSGWNQTGLFTGSIGRPGYNAYVFMTTELKDAIIGSAITQYTGLRGYSFTAPGKTIWVLWSPNGITGINITLPANISAIYDKYGASISQRTGTMTITHPTYIEFPR